MESKEDPGEDGSLWAVGNSSCSCQGAFEVLSTFRKGGWELPARGHRGQHFLSICKTLQGLLLKETSAWTQKLAPNTYAWTKSPDPACESPPPVFVVTQRCRGVLGSIPWLLQSTREHKCIKRERQTHHCHLTQPFCLWLFTQKLKQELRQTFVCLCSQQLYSCKRPGAGNNPNVCQPMNK